MAVKIMQKKYHLVSSSGLKLVVHPPQLPGLNQDRKKPKNKQGQYIRVYQIVDDNGVDTTGFDRPDGINDDQIVLYHAPGEFPSCEVAGVTWTIEPIDGEIAKKPRKTTAVAAAPTVAATPVAESDVETEATVEDTTEVTAEVETEEKATSEA